MLLSACESVQNKEMTSTTAPKIGRLVAIDLDHRGDEEEFFDFVVAEADPRSRPAAARPFIVA